MKPTVQFDETSRCDLDSRELRKGATFPKTDFSFQAASATNGGGRCFGACRPSFCDISQDYFKNEAGRSFASEAALFVVMAMTVAPAFLISLTALAHLVRSFAAL